MNFVDNRWPRGQPLLTRQLFGDETPCPIPSKRSHHFDTDTTTSGIRLIKTGAARETRRRRAAAAPSTYSMVQATM